MFNCFRDQNKFVDSDGESDDSNQENYYRNEYPDSEESDGGRAMRRAIDKMRLDEEMAGESSDDEDYYEGEGQKKPADEYVHTLEVDEPGFVGDVDFQDTADKYGVAYAKYKKKILKAFDNAAEVPTDDDDSDNSSGSDFYLRNKGDYDEEDCYSENELDKFA